MPLMFKHYYDDKRLYNKYKNTKARVDIWLNIISNFIIY